MRLSSAKTCLDTHARHIYACMLIERFALQSHIHTACISMHHTYINGYTHVCINVWYSYEYIHACMCNDTLPYSHAYVLPKRLRFASDASKFEQMLAYIQAYIHVYYMYTHIKTRTHMYVRVMMSVEHLIV